MDPTARGRSNARRPSGAASIQRMRTIAIGFIVLFALGCGPSEEAVCEMKCDCEGCSDSEFDHCLDEYDDDLRRAENEDCLDYWDELMACREDTGWCKDDHEFKDDCGPEKDRFKHCVD
jgi:hypothetical protein